MKKIIYLVLLVNSFYCNAQLEKTIHEMTKPSPEVASLGKYGELPINHYTGTANIDVPLHEIDFDGLKIPINLNYSTGGIKTSEEASWVGLGWGLSVEPIITRRIQGLGDIDQINTQFGFPYTNIALPEYSSDYSYTGPLHEKISLHEDGPNVINTWDTQPDIFSISLFGETAKFMLTQKSLNGGVIGVKMLNDDSRIKMTYVENGRSFIATNDRGFSFYFTKHEYSVFAVDNDPYIETYQVYDGFDNPQITAWKIEKIVSPNGNIVSYTYLPTATISDQPSLTEKKHQIACTEQYSGAFHSWSHIAQTSSSINCHATLYLSSIHCNDFRIEFRGSERLDIMDSYDRRYTFINTIFGFSNQKALKLDRIVVKDFLGREVKNINLTYTYFDANRQNDPLFAKEHLRLKLDEISINSEFYRRFDYLNPDLLPNKRTKSLDYWGYYNGKTNVCIYPSHKGYGNCWSGSTLILIPGADRTPDFNFGKNGLLNRITYPTKGYTEIQYEAHDILLNSQTRNANLPFEDFETVEATSYDEATPANSNIFTLNGSPVDYAYKRDGTVDDPPTSLFGHATLEISCGSEFQPGGGSSSYRKCNVAPEDMRKTVLEVINADNGQVISARQFTEEIICYNACTPLTVNGVTKINIQLGDLPAGRYYFRVRALKHISNLYDEQEGSYPGSPDYMKQYYFPVRIKAKIPKSAIYSSYSKQIGGSRIASIKNYEHGGSVISSKNYKYIKEPVSGNLPNESSGMLIGDLIFAHQYKYRTNMDACIGDPGPGQNGGITTQAFTIYSENRQDQHSPQQVHVGYSRIEENHTDFSGISNGKTVYHYSLKKNENVYYGNNPFYTILRPLSPVYDESNYALVPLKTYEESNGDLLKTEYFDKQGDIKKGEAFEYFYHDYYPQRKIATGMLIKFYPIFEFNCTTLDRIYGSLENMQIYNIKNEVTPIQKKTITEYLSGGNVATSTEYSYNGRYLPSVIATASSEGTPSTIKNYYPGDSETAGFPSSSTLVSKNIIGSPMRSEKFSGMGLLEQVDKEYSLFNANTLLAESKMKALKGGGLMEDLFEYQQYDSRGNVLQYKKASGVPVSVIWGYKSGLPVAKLENVEYSSISAQAIANIQSKSETGTEAELITALNSLRASFTDAMITTYTYRPLIGMSSLTDPKGIKTSFQYDAFGRLELIKDNEGNVITHNQYHYKL